MNFSLHTLSEKEAEAHLAGVSDIAYAREFFLFQEKHYALQSEYLGIYNDASLLAVIPVNHSAKEAFSVHKDYVVPHIMTRDGAIDWEDVAQRIRRHYAVRSAQFYFAGSTGRKTALSTFVARFPSGLTHEEIRMRYNKKTRNEVRKGEKASFTLCVGGPELLDDFHRLYQENMERHGTPPKGRRYFEDLFSCFGEKCRIIAAYEGSVLAGANFILLHNTYLRLSFNVSKINYWDKCVNNFLYDRMIAQWYDAGARIFDFGPSLNKDASHNKFKIGYGAQPVPLVMAGSSSGIQRVKGWLAQKRHNLKIRVRKVKKYI